MEFGDALRKLWPRGNSRIPGLVEGIIKSAPAVFAKHGITEGVVLAHIMAQISHECGAGTEVVENLNYSARRMIEVWPSRFKSLADAQPYANNPRALANKVYNGVKPDGSDRMGNRPGTDDGWNYRGRGATQTTGRYGYRRLSQTMGVDFLTNPDAVNDPALFLECGVQDFINCGCLPYARLDNLVKVTERLNGGRIGLDQRAAWLADWKRCGVKVPTAHPIDLPPVIPTEPKPEAKSNWIITLIKAIFSWKR